MLFLQQSGSGCCSGQVSGVGICLVFQKWPRTPKERGETERSEGRCVAVLQASVGLQVLTE